MFSYTGLSGVTALVLKKGERVNLKQCLSPDKFRFIFINPSIMPLDDFAGQNHR